MPERRGDGRLRHRARIHVHRASRVARAIFEPLLRLLGERAAKRLARVRLEDALLDELAAEGPERLAQRHVPAHLGDLGLDAEQSGDEGAHLGRELHQRVAAGDVAEGFVIATVRLERREQLREEARSHPSNA